MSIIKLNKLINDDYLAKRYKEIYHELKKVVNNNEYTLTHLFDVLESLGIYIEIKEYLLSNKLKVNC